MKLNQNINEQKNNYAKLANYAQKIGEGDYITEYEFDDSEDRLGRALVNMSNNLLSNKKQRDERNWLTVGRDKIALILREEVNTEELSYKVLVELINYIDIIQGSFFIVKENTGKDATIDHVASYAYGKKMSISSSIKLGDGLVGEVAVKQQTIHRTEIPERLFNNNIGIPEG